MMPYPMMPSPRKFSLTLFQTVVVRRWVKRGQGCREPTTCKIEGRFRQTSPPRARERARGFAPYIVSDISAPGLGAWFPVCSGIQAYRELECHKCTAVRRYASEANGRQNIRRVISAPRSRCVRTLYSHRCLRPPHVGRRFDATKTDEYSWRRAWSRLRRLFRERGSERGIFYPKSDASIARA